MPWFRRRHRPLNRQQIDALLDLRFGPGDAERVRSWILPAILLRNGRLGREPWRLGTTRFGGRPDLPRDTPWPEGPDGPLAFLGQLSLTELAAFDVDGALPKSGLLSFFFNIADYAWGTDLSDREKFKVIYSGPDSKLSRRPFPRAIRDEHHLERSRRVEPHIHWQLPSVDPLALRSMQVGKNPAVSEPDADPFTKAYWGFERYLIEPLIPIGDHQVLGWANHLYQQEVDARRLCEAARQQFPPDLPEANETISRERGAWRCLLQVDDSRAVYRDTWGDCGTLAFFIRNEDLARCDFDHCWIVMLT